MRIPEEREQALRAFFSSPRASERHAPLPVIHLSRVLQMPVWELYQLSNRQSRHYQSLRIPKQSGGFRELHVPDEPLRQVQEAILRRILSGFAPAESATAYHPGASLLQNALPHVGKPLVLKLDIRDFFDSISYALVRSRVFSGDYFPAPAAAMLTSLCTLDDLLPQGAPTSPAAANLVMREFDLELSAWCGERRIAYTRYCDDMAFSGDFSPREVLCRVREGLRPLGMELHREKTLCLPAWKAQRVTGVSVNSRPRMPAAARRALRQTLYYCRKFGPADHLLHTGAPGPRLPDDSPDVPAYLRSLLGRVDFALQLDPGDRELRDSRSWLLETLRRG